MHRKQYWPVIGLLLLYTLTRLHAIHLFPLFQDEGLVIQWAQDTLHGKALYFVFAGRALASWWLALFNPYVAPIWIGRVSQVLIGLVGAASIYLLGRRLHSHLAGMIALVALILSPLSFFFERMLIPDGIATSLTLAVFAFALTPTPRRRDGMIVGILLFAAILSRVTLIVLVVVPLLVFFLNRSRNMLAASYTTLALLLVPTLLFFRWRGQNYFLGFSVKGGSISGGASTSVVERAIANTRLLFEAAVGYWAIIPVLLIIILIIAALVYSRKSRVIATAIILLLGPIIVLGQVVTIRYFVVGLALLLLLACVGLAIVTKQVAGQIAKWQATPIPAVLLPTILIALWAIFVALPFQWTAYTSPMNLPLPTTDRFEYLSGEASGSGLAEISHKLDTLPGDVHVVGWLSNCVGLAHYVNDMHHIKLECPTINWMGKTQNPLSEALQSRANAGEKLYVVSENLPYLPDSLLPANHTEVETFARPGGKPLVLWQIN